MTSEILRPSAPHHDSEPLGGAIAHVDRRTMPLRTHPGYTVFQPRYRTSHNSIWKIVLELEDIEPRTMVMKTHTILILGGSGKEYAEKKPKAQVTKPFLGCDISMCGGMTVLNTYEVWCPIPQHHVGIARRRPTADNSAILEACVHAVGDDEHGTHSSRNVGVTRCDSRHMTDTGRAEKNQMLNGPAIVEICMLAVGNDEHKGVLAVTDDVYCTSETEYVEEIPALNGSAILEIFVLAVDNDEHGRVFTVTGDARTSASHARDTISQI
ncbi:hypothetical protein F5141DRAFT_1066159 [Pisolithus sp. B1]|nr:hypothetical protein F5141DRAFT_1066159 [Pisolithus sp. B1]